MEKLLIISLFSFLFTLIGTKYLKKFLEIRKIYDVPNERSSHIKPIPKGGGWIINLCIIGIIFFLDPYDKIPVIITITGLAFVSWQDDLKNINVIVRLLFQVIFISIYFLFLYSFGFYNQTQLIHIFFIIFLFTWFINIFNFMDGIDGISTLMCITICTGIIFAYLLNDSQYFPAFEILIISICFAFLFWNWCPAKIFLGDVGSIVLGFICILSLYWLFLEGNTWHWVISLPMYYILDTTLTLMKRFIEGKRVWKAHREHYYQKAVQSGMTHSKVVLSITILQILIIFTCYSIKNPYLVVFLSFLESLLLIIYFSSKYKKST
tara:strand:+ start:1448 stop:2413 length:966 start_codon:yes stop_codon:yes gene_type:complete